MNKNKFKKLVIAKVFLLLGSITYGFGQQTEIPRPLNVAVPFLLINPDARSGAMGDAGAATPSDLNALINNPSKIVFIDQDAALSLSYSPWLPSLAKDLHISYLSGFKKLINGDALGGSVRFFSMGKYELSGENYERLGIYQPTELAVDLSYAKKFGPSFAMAISSRYIYSALSSANKSIANVSSGNAFAVDISATYSTEIYLCNTETQLSSGINLSNIGTKMNYGYSSGKTFLPSNLKIGGALTFMLDDLSQITYALDFNKLMVPSTPIYNTEGEIIAGEDMDKSVPEAIFGSFSDAPNGFREELQEVSLSTGLEYSYNNIFALRGGYIYENPLKGYKRYLTMGLGIAYKKLGLDFAYILGNPTKNPQANTLRFTLKLKL